MKVYVFKDETYPIYGIEVDKRWHRASELVEIPDALYKKYKKITKEYGEVQEELEKYSCE